MKLSARSVKAGASVALLIAALAQELLLAPSMGLNMTILLLGTSVSLLVLEWKQISEYKLSKLWFHLPLWIAAFGFGFVDSEGSDAANTLLVLLTIGWLGLQSIRQRVLSLVESFIIAPFTGLIAFLIPLLLPSHIEASGKDKRQLERSKPIVIGAALAFPVVLIFGSILSSADPMFGKTISSLSVLDPDTFGLRAVTLVTTFSLVLGAIVLVSPKMAPAVWATVSGGTPPLMAFDTVAQRVVEVNGPVQPSKGKVVREDSALVFQTFFVLLISLFGLFLAFQFRYLFGGNDMVLKTEGLTYADYARRGFFEVMGVSITTMPILLFWQEYLQNAPDEAKRKCRWVIATMASLLMLLLISAGYRMGLYIQAYGLTTLRFYTGAIMVWLLGVLGYYGFNGTKWKLSKIPSFFYASLIAMVSSINLIRPDSLIARVNLTRPEVDVNTVMALGHDADRSVQFYGTKDIQSRWANVESARTKNWKALTVSQLR